MSAIIAAKPDATSAGDLLEAHLDAEIDGVRDLVAKADPLRAIALFERLLARVLDTASGRIVFRLKANIGICRFVLGDDRAAASLLEDAFHHAPEEPRAIANLALSMLLRGETRRLREFADAELARDPSNEHLAGLLIQAMRGDDGVADPFDLVPEGSRNSAPATVARVEFLRMRGDVPAWWAAAKAAVSSFPEDAYARQFAAEAVVDEAFRSKAFVTSGIVPGEAMEALRAALDALIERWQAAVDGPGAVRPEHVGLCCNILGALLALGEESRAVDIARKGRELAHDDEALAIRAALVGFETGDDALVEEAMTSIPECPDLNLLRFRVLARRGDWAGIIALEGREVPESERRMVATATRLARIKLSAPAIEIEALNATLEDAAGDPRASVLVAETAASLGQAAVADRAYGDALRATTGESHRATRTMVARLAAARASWVDVIALLDGHVAADRDCQELRLLAPAHTNATPIRRGAPRFFEGLSARVAQLPFYLQARGLMNYNRGALPEAEADLRRAMAAAPDLTSLIALVAVLRRAGRKDVGQELAGVDAASIPGSPGERMALCHELLDAGRAKEAFDLGYRVLRANPAEPVVALRYIGLALKDLSGRHIPAMPTAGPDAWIRLESDSGEVFEAVIEVDETLRGGSDVSPRHPFAAAAEGLASGCAFEHAGAIGTTTWTLKGLKHKFLHALHVVTDTFQTRFPDEGGFFRLSVEAGDMSTVLDQVRRSSEAARTVADLHLEKNLPLEFAGGRAVGGAIGLAQYIAMIGADVATCVGTEAERLQARATVLEHRGDGAVLDTLTAWTAATLGILTTLKTLFGTLAVPRSALDAIRALRNGYSGDGNGMSMHWSDGAYTKRAHTREDRIEEDERIDRIVADIEASCIVAAVLAPDDPGDLAATLTEIFGPHSLDAAHLSAERNATLLSDDLHYRQMTALATGAPRSAWTQGVLLVAKELGHMDDAAYDAASLGLAARRHGHVTIDGGMLARSVSADGDPLERTTILARYIGGANAEVASHLNAVQRVLAALWSRPMGLKEMRATGLFLERLLHGRFEARQEILSFLWNGGNDGLRSYVSSWATGHMMPITPTSQREGRPADPYGRRNERSTRTGRRHPRSRPP